MLVFEKLSQTLASAYKWDVGIAGTYLRLAACPWPVTVILYKGGQVIGQMNNMLAGDYVDGVAFDAVSILNGAMAQTVDVQISGGGAGSNRVLGEVSVINGELQRVKAGRAFIAAPFVAAAVGTISHVQLWNPAGSGKNLIISKAVGYANTISTVIMNSYNVALGALFGNGTNKLLGGAASVAELRTGQNVDALGVNLAVTAAAVANDSREILFSEPLIVPPAAGVLVFAGATNSTLSVTYQWQEESI